jgi:hypothetical protein
MNIAGTIAAATHRGRTSLARAPVRLPAKSIRPIGNRPQHRQLAALPSTLLLPGKSIRPARWQLCYLGNNRPSIRLQPSALVHRGSHEKTIHPTCNRPQHRWPPRIAECTLVTKSTHAIRKPSSAARSQHVPSWQGNEIPTIRSGNIQAQQKAQHQTAFSSDIKHTRQNSPQPQVTSVSLLSTPCNLVHNRPVGAEGLEPPTSWV